MLMQTCRSHPEAGSFMATCSGCAQELYDIEQANRAAAAKQRTEKIRAHLGLTGQSATHLGDAARVNLWSVRELDAVYVRTGGTVTAERVERALSDGTTYSVIEVTLTVPVPGITCPVQVVTDWDADWDGNDWGTIRALRPGAAKEL